MDAQVPQGRLVEDPRRRVIVFLFLLTAMFMSTLDTQIVSTALPTIVGEFGQIERFGWIGSAYLLSLSAMMPIYGKLGDLFGRKPVMMAAIFIFTIGSATCGLATSMNTLIAARVLQGLGGGGIMVSIFSVNADLFEARERARYQSYSSLVLMAASAIGPSLGGIMSDVFGWRSIFWINIPIGALVLTGLAIMLPYRKPHRRPIIDYLGALLLASTTTSLVLTADANSIFGSLLAPQSLGVIAFGTICAVLWVLVERRAPEPIVPLILFRNQTFNLLLVVTIMGGGIAIGMVNYFSLYLQTTTGLSPLAAGLLFLFMTGGIVVGSLTSGQFISRTGRYKPFVVISFSLSTAAFVLIQLVGNNPPLAFIAAIFIIHGIGLGLAQQISILGVQNAAAQRDVGAATGAVSLSRMGGASIAISIYGAIIGTQLERTAPIPGVADVRQLSPQMIAALPAATRHAVAAAYSAAFSPLFMTCLAIALMGLMAALMLKPIQLPRDEKLEAPAQKAAE